MAITSSAKRAIRVASRRKVYNSRRMNTMRESIKSFKKMVVSGTPEVAEKSLSTLYKAIDKAAKRGVIKKKTASRKKSRIIALLRKQTVK